MKWNSLDTINFSELDKNYSMRAALYLKNLVATYKY